MFLKVAWLVMRKDLTVEVRSREVIYTTIFFAVACVLESTTVPVECRSFAVLMENFVAC